MNNSLDITDEELLLIKSVTVDGEADFLYFGTKEFERLKNLGFWDSIPEPGELCMNVMNYYGMKVSFRGILTENDYEICKRNEELFGEIIVASIVRCLRSNR